MFLTLLVAIAALWMTFAHRPTGTPGHLDRERLERPASRDGGGPPMVAGRDSAAGRVDPERHREVLHTRRDLGAHG